ncbi:phosphotransferase enzyme family protein [Empedobacter stercoris]|uniref:Aminoglycoside phosphotransferase family protein n=1 Tax=Empedobacter stercoris TaxID=1628248 RepID=A0ABX1WI62_9FLAO|nr:aminoglycoside phosphotransferase family protein [Empedobacter stercoris]NOJ74362.1 aminoglycoside phosphotransferase family protein [Empedobacter stercoris]
MEEILKHYFENIDQIVVNPISSGWINSTYEINQQGKKYILQKINTKVFPHPEIISNNIQQVSTHLKAKNYPKQLIEIIPDLKGNLLAVENEETWRLTSYISNSVCFDKVESAEQAYEAAKTISQFHSFILDLDIKQIHPSIDGFLDYQKRMQDFNVALQNASEERLQETKYEINYILDNASKVKEYLAIDFPKRVVHADAKLSNFLFNSENHSQAIALIDWDTIMPGNILCDFGDMIRTYANLKQEDDPTAENIFESSYYKAVKRGFLEHLKNDLQAVEVENMDFVAYIVIYIQAVRFLGDYLNNDVYYSITYPKQNLNRTINQINLLKALTKFHEETSIRKV